MAQGLAEVRRKRGTLDRDVVLEEATDPTHPLHRGFEWDNEKGGHEYRLIQAGRMLRTVKLPPEGDRPHELRAYVAVRGANTPKAEYIPTEEALANPISRELVLRDMEREWHALRRRWQHMQEFADLLRVHLGEVAA